MSPAENTQRAPYPTALAEACADLAYKPGWDFSLLDIDRDYSDAERLVPTAGGLTFVILVPCHDSYHPDRYRPVSHYHPVPAATYNRAAWERWLLDRILETECHEACEYLRFGTEERRPFAPTHGPGDNPYVVHEYASDQQRRTSYRGAEKPG